MNNTATTTIRRRTVLSISAIFIAVTLVVGIGTTTTIASQSAFAYPQKKKGGGDENSKNGNTITIQKCKQAATQSGFDNNQGQECENLICTHPGENATCVQEGVVSTAAQSPIPTPKTCVECFRSILTSAEISGLSFEQVCAFFEQNNVGLAVLVNFLSLAQISPDVQARLISCLINAGVHFTTETSA
jgi:ABC-type antimicrobial peptide transport system permease subunit